MIGRSRDNSARRWDLQTGKQIKDPKVICEWGVWAVAVSRDSRWVVTGGGNPGGGGLQVGELKACEVDIGKMKTFEGLSHVVSSIDISVDNKLLASGSGDYTARIWDLNTGELVAGPFKCAGIAGTVRFSQNSKKLAVKSGVFEMCLEVWDIQEQKLDRRVGEAIRDTWSETPVFWTTKDRSIVTTWDDDFLSGRIYEFDPSTLETVGAPFEHAQTIIGLALSLDCVLLASSSPYDNTIKLWAFESCQLLASFDVHNPYVLILSPNSRQLAYTTQDSVVHICDIPLDILARIWPEQATRSVCVFTAYIHFLSTNSSDRPLRLSIRTPSTNSMYMILFSHPLISLIIPLL